MMMAFAVTAAIMSIDAMALVLVIAYDIRVKFQAAGQQVGYSLVSIAAYAAIQINTCFSKSAFSAIADTAADKRVYAPFFQNISQCAMAAAVCVNNGGYLNLSILYIVNLKSFCVPKMLKYLSTFICHCDSHCCASISSSKLSTNRLL